MRVLIHELQHCIQLEEGFEVGESYYGGEGVCDARILEEFLLDKNGKVNLSLIESLAGSYETPFFKFEDFKKSFNAEKEEVFIKSPIGSVKIDLKSQYYKLKKWKENRIHLSGIIKSTIENPLFIVNHNNSRKYYAPYRSDKRLRHIFSVTEDENGIDILKSNYEPFNLKRIKELISVNEEDLIYVKDSITALSRNHSNAEKGIEDAVYSEIIPNLEDKVNSKNDDNIIFHKKDNPLLKEDREKNFKDWFGDSKVVDENGEPLVVYHGTGASFDEFATNPISWVSTSRSHANKYADKVVPDWKISKNNVMPLYISVKNPYCFKVAEFAKTTEREMMIDMMMDTENRTKIDGQNIDKIESLIKKADRRSEQACLIWNSSSNLKEVALLLGYDGYEAFEVDSSMNEKRTYYKTYAAFSPTQIKSIHNKGAFDPKNPNILEKNDYGLRHIEKIISIIPNGMSKDGIYKYLELNNVSKEDIKDTSFYNIIENDIFINPIKNTNSIDKDSSYWNNKGEIESREIEDKYISLSSIIKIDDSIENMSDSEIKDMLTRLAHDRVDVDLV